MKWPDYADVEVLHQCILAMIPAGGSVLDIGSGFGKYHPQAVEKARRYVMLDAHKPYLDAALSRPNIEKWHAVAADALPMMADGAFDTVLAMDVIEHMTKEVGTLVIQEAKRIGKRVALLIPEGEHPQDKDAYGLGGDYWQTHRSTWYADDLRALGFNVAIWPRFHEAKNPAAPGALWATIGEDNG